MNRRCKRVGKLNEPFDLLIEEAWKVKVIDGLKPVVTGANKADLLAVVFTGPGFYKIKWLWGKNFRQLKGKNPPWIKGVYQLLAVPC